MGIHDGYIALWKKEEEKPVQVFPYRAQMLPPADQQALAQGIPVTSDQQLHRLLEDYLS